MDDGVGLSALPEPGTAGIGSLWSRWDGLMQSMFGDSIVQRTIAARDALRRGDAQAAHEATMPVAQDFASFVGNIKPVGAGVSAIVAGSKPKSAETLDEVLSPWREAGVVLNVTPRAKENVLVIDKIVVPKNLRNQGIGSEAMGDITDYADKNGLRMLLSPSTDFGATSINRLKAFYKRLGFVENKGRHRDFTISDSMYRDPAKELP